VTGSRAWSLAPDGKPRPDAPFGRGPLAARVLGTVINGAAWLGARIPSGVAHALAVVGGNLEWAARPRKRRLLATNLAQAIDRPAGSAAVRALVRREIVNEAHRSADLLWSIGRRGEFTTTTRVEGREHAAAAIARGRGVILVGTHLGGWEVAASVPAGVLPVPTSVVVSDDWLAWGIQHVRAAAGLRILYAGRSAFEAMRVLRHGEALLVLGDDGSRSTAHAYPVEFCGTTAMLPAGVVTLARTTGAPLVPFTVLPEGPRRWTVTIEPALDPPERGDGHDGERVVLQRLADVWTASIRRHPEHWAASFPIEWRDAS
jgi:lauroyl/myristoyl acyltransferase